jgi:choline dehydrogenase-like flavoprotein
MTETFDYIVVGGGSSGCVVAARLAAEKHARVLLLEAGHSHRHPLLDMPPGIFKMIKGSKFMTYHKTIPQEHLNGRARDIPQGNVLGGGSSVNAQVYMRGRPADYEEWDELLRGDNDNPGWGWEHVLPVFRAMEANSRLHDERHGVDGPLLVSDPGHIDDFSRWFVQSVQALGEPFNHDFNGPSQRGAGFYQFTNRRGRHSSAPYAFLAPLEKDPNLTVRLRAVVQRIELDHGRATGVVYRDSSGSEQRVAADGEVIVAAGALVTPKVLMLSGVGPADHLRSHGIECRVDLPGVGENLIDHPEVPIVAMANGRHGYYRQSVGWRMLLNGLQFKLFGTGRITSAGVEAGAFINPTERDAEPAIQAFCVPIVYLDRDTVGLVEDTYGVTVTTVVVKPKSRGFVRLRSADPSAMPLVSPHLLKHPSDMRTMVEGQRFFLRAFRTSPLKERARVGIPDPADSSDEALEAHCRRFVKTNYHPSGTCRIGARNDPKAVLDPRMRVRGVERLRVCDLSAMPNINAGNTNAPALMLGARCAEFIMGV